MATNLARNSRVLTAPFLTLATKCLCPNSTFNCSRLQFKLKGHSHWQNIKFKKAHIDFARSKEFGKLSIDIISAVRESGPDVKFNRRLETLIEKAKMISMPKEKIENAIKSGAGSKDSPYETSILEIKGPGGCGLLVQILTTNKMRTRNEVNTILRKNGGLLKDGGSVTFQYDHKGVVTVDDFLFNEDKNDLSSYPDDDVVGKAEEIAIESGAENLFFFDSENGRKNIKFVCTMEDSKHVFDNLSAKFPDQVLSSELEYIPHTLVPLSDEHLQQAGQLIDTLEDHVDVMHVYDNIEHYPSATCKLFGST